MRSGDKESMDATLTVNDVELYYTRWGNEGDTPIMLLHGWTGGNELFRDFRFMLAERGFDVLSMRLTKSAFWVIIIGTCSIFHELC